MVAGFFAPGRPGPRSNYLVLQAPLHSAVVRGQIRLDGLRPAGGCSSLWAQDAWTPREPARMAASQWPTDRFGSIMARGPQAETLYANRP
jgi:hypothetical protein